MSLVYGIPFIPFKIAANERIKSPANGIYGSGLVAGSLVPARKISAIYDSRPSAVQSGLYLVWGSKGAELGGGNPVFHQADVVAEVTAHLFSPEQHTSDDIDEMFDRFSRLFRHQPLVMTGYTTQSVDFTVISVIPDPYGQHGVASFRAICRTNQ